MKTVKITGDFEVKPVEPVEPTELNIREEFWHRANNIPACSVVNEKHFIVRTLELLVNGEYEAAASFCCDLYCADGIGRTRKGFWQYARDEETSSYLNAIAAAVAAACIVRGGNFLKAAALLADVYCVRERGSM